jgi:glucosamine-6-phosphate deaminase
MRTRRIRISATARQAASAAARIVAAALGENPRLVIALPTGRTSIAFYEALVALHGAGWADFARASTFNLDEFLGLPRVHPGSYREFMRRHLFAHVNVRQERTHLLDGAAADWEIEAARFEQDLAACGGLDLAIVGIGRNGHVAFNEPAPALVPRTHRARLHASTRRSNAEAFGGRWRAVPTHALTMGMATILRARRVVLLATGGQKAAIVRRALAGPITTAVPASFLQTHPDLIAVLDRAAAARLEATAP